MPNILDTIRETNLTTINDGSEVSQSTHETNVTEPHSIKRLNNALVSKVLEDIIVEHCANYNNEQSQQLMNDVQSALNQVRISIIR
tara:strand:+ start:189 stop:446 length:258 start_codon:yes stop_codon:yes gene_type:complete